ncbi:MAG: nicotinate-nucleotide diphosphorylase (carboxylating) [Kangiellaceae bacterium]|nr:nicotinate-nucleotide diphosphorylase (carboxylating) [Kangiellaceae bacterium]
MTLQISFAEIGEQVERALAEDLGGAANLSNDLTAQLIDIDKQATATIVTRDNAVICGQAWVDASLKRIDPHVSIEWQVAEGELVQANTLLATISGNARALLCAERTALNFLQTLSGTATVAQQYANQLKGCATKILDTRKTIPGLRAAQKYAVATGGGQNHRFGLFDAYLIKENHIMACGGIAEAIAKAKELTPGKVIEVEVESLDELQQALDANADIIMLDNFSTEDMTLAVQRVAGKAKLEASGNVELEQLTTIAQTGVDYISSGALTKNIKAIDLSMRITL